MVHRASSDPMFLLPLIASSRLFPSTTGPLNVMLLSRILPLLSSPSLLYQFLLASVRRPILNNAFSGPLTLVNLLAFRGLTFELNYICIL